MRCNFHLLALMVLAAVLLLAKSDNWAVQRIELRASNSQVEVIGADVDHVVFDESSPFSVRNVEGRSVIVPEKSNQGPISVTVPRHSSLDIATSNGAIHVSGVDGPMQLITSNGAIRVLDARGAELHAHTTNGSIDIEFPQELHTDLSAHTSNGMIHYKGEIAFAHRSENYLEGKIGGGGPKLDLQTSNGSITLSGVARLESEITTLKSDEAK